MGHHYVGTVEIKVGQAVNGVWHRFADADRYVEYWMLRADFEMWEGTTPLSRTLSPLGRLADNDAEVNFRIYALKRLGYANTPNPPVRFWKHVVTERSV